MGRRKILKKICEAIEEKKGDEVLILDISEISSFTDFFILCQGYNQRQNQAICDGIKEKLKREDERVPTHVEGYDEAEWILMDYLDCIVHILSPEARRYYQLERLWNDGVAVEREVLTA
jgi:ribosome-associated protein